MVSVSRPSSALTSHLDDICGKLTMLTADSTIIASMPNIHDQHSKIAEKYSELVAAMQDDAKAAARPKMFANMIAFVAMHFAVENAYMKSLSYPLTTRHVEQHASFIRNVNALSDEVRQGMLSVEELVLFIGHWLVGHLLLADTQFEEFQASMSAEEM